MDAARESPLRVRPVSRPRIRAALAKSSSRSVRRARTGTARLRSCVRAGSFSAVEYATARSGCRATTASTLGGKPSPTLGIASAAGGQSHHRVRPMIWLPAPMANSSSVTVGLRETIRLAGRASRTCCPPSSSALTGAAARGGHTASSSVKPRTGGNDRRARINQTAHPRGAEDGRTSAEWMRPESPPVPPPRGCVVAREQRSPGFGPSLAFPVAQWLVSEVNAPVTVAGPRRICTGFRASALVMWEG
jgi:hypothetical protein